MIYYKHSDWVHGFEHEPKSLSSRITALFNRSRTDPDIPEEEDN